MKSILKLLSISCLLVMIMTGCSQQNGNTGEEETGEEIIDEPTEGATNSIHGEWKVISMETPDFVYDQALNTRMIFNNDNTYIKKLGEEPFKGHWKIEKNELILTTENNESDTARFTIKKLTAEELVYSFEGEYPTITTLIRLENEM